MKLPRLFSNPRVWLAAVIAWFVTLWLLSAGHPTVQLGPEIPHLDKFCHFGYFLGGSGLLSAYLFSRSSATPDWRIIGLGVVVALALVGCLDEYHQTFTPERSGNDLGDWLADVSGSLAGFLIFKWCHRVLPVRQ